MTKIIFAIIKNEHHYIEEWVEYHHNIVGIDHIYLIEDIGSEPHKDLLSKYDYVTLYPLLDLINEDEMHLLEKKEDKVFIAYHIFYRAFMDKCDWCAYIDADEFIAIKNDELNNILINNADKQSITMKWVNMKCCGHIHHPNNWKKYSVIETYTKGEVGGLGGENYKQILNCAPKFREKLHIDNWEWFPHIINSNENNFDGDIYLLHFFSKSFEEYKYKMEVRGQCSSGMLYSRNYDDWFKINPEYKNVKDELFNEFNINTTNRLFSDYTKS